jgi:anti-sigma factor (TIGR02949 family)
MVSCHEVVAELWDYLDGELPAERAALIAEHLAECARCYPLYRFEYGLLAAVARQRGAGPAPSRELIEKVAGVVLGGAAAGRAGARRPDAERRRPAPRAAAPLRPRVALTPPGARGERWALTVLRISLGVFLLVSSAGRIVTPVPAAVIAPRLWAAAAGLQALLAGIVLLGLWRRWSYAAALGVHVASLLAFWNASPDPWGLALAGLPTCGALIAMHVLRERDPWTLDAWFAWRRSSRLADFKTTT